jgi:hypothetical protein
MLAVGAAAAMASAVSCGPRRFHLSDDAGNEDASDEGGEAGPEAAPYDAPVDTKRDSQFTVDGTLPEANAGDGGLEGLDQPCDPSAPASECEPGLLCCPGHIHGPDGGALFQCVSAPEIPPRCPAFQ